MDQQQDQTTDNLQEHSGELDESRREFFRKCRKTAIVTAPAVAMLLAQGTSTAKAFPVGVAGSGGTTDPNGGCSGCAG